MQARGGSQPAVSRYAISVLGHAIDAATRKARDWSLTKASTPCARAMSWC